MSSRTSSSTRRLFSTFAAAALVATGAIATAMPAQAANLGIVTFTGSSIVIEADLTDYFQFDNATVNNVRLVNVTPNALSDATAACTGTPRCQFATFVGGRVDVGAYGTVNVVNQSGGAVLATLTIVAPTGDSSESSQLPPPVVQQFGKPASGSCDAAAPAALNWSGVASGGWGESWAQWMNGGKGGAVCTRMLVYSSSRGAWTVG